MLPKLTPLQYLVLNLLFVGRQSSDELRRELRALGVRQSRAAFSRLMSRLVDATYVDPQPGTRSLGGQIIRCCRYEVTDLGVLDWIASRKFYLNLAPPSHDLTPVETQSGQLAVYDEKVRKKAMFDNVYEHVERFASAVCGIDLRQRQKSQ